MGTDTYMCDCAYLRALFSVNSKNMYTVNYTKFDEAVAIVQISWGGAPVKSKLDIKTVFRICLVCYAMYIVL